MKTKRNIYSCCRERYILMYHSHRRKCLLKWKQWPELMFCQVQKNGIPMEEEEEEEEESLGNDGTANGMEAPQVGRGPQTTVLRIQLVFTRHWFILIRRWIIFIRNWMIGSFWSGGDHFERLGNILIRRARIKRIRIRNTNLIRLRITLMWILNILVHFRIRIPNTDPDPKRQWKRTRNVCSGVGC